ncbi:hypothetical protein DNTS_028898 [Danionella cerebrum]|uniref:Uncharacterized protein n=1 Tax=Danionella cerebrum TaxID=2873325 RepID=A0A553N4W8_9TELE|nr:hypothetical protein DNTS_028898 [Danionella translucida]
MGVLRRPFEIRYFEATFKVHHLIARGACGKPRASASPWKTRKSHCSSFASSRPRQAPESRQGPTRPGVKKEKRIAIKGEETAPKVLKVKA